MTPSMEHMEGSGGGFQNPFSRELPPPPSICPYAGETRSARETTARPETPELTSSDRAPRPPRDGGEGALDGPVSLGVCEDARSGGTASRWILPPEGLR